MPEKIRLNVTVNDVAHDVLVEPRTLVLDFLRDELELTGAHAGCEHGVCGACTVLVDGEATRSCLMFAAQLDGDAIVSGPDGERTVTAADLFTGAFETSLGAGELITAVRVPRGTAPRTGSAWVEVSRRHGDLPVCGAGAVVTLGDDGTIASARVALCGVGATPLRATAVEEALAGAEPTGEAVAAAADAAARDLDPPSDPHGSADFRRHLAVVMTRRSVQRAAERAREGAPDA